MKLYEKAGVFLLILLFGVTAHAQINVTQRTIESSVTLLWEASSYTPPFYKGKALYGTGVRVTILAYPSASLGNPDALTYTWKKNGTVDGAQSGIGKRSFVLYEEMFSDSPLIIVEVSNGTKKEFGALRIQQESPFVLFYENRPLEGVALEQSLPNNITKEIGTFTLEAYPYFFSGTSRMSDSLTYSWSVNNKHIDAAVGPTMALESAEEGVIPLAVSVNNPSHILQYTSNNIRVSFE